jgi:hypothetical protein
MRVRSTHSDSPDVDQADAERDTSEQITSLGLSSPQSSVVLSHEFQDAIRPGLERLRHPPPVGHRKSRSLRRSMT